MNGRLSRRGLVLGGAGLAGAMFGGGRRAQAGPVVSSEPSPENVVFVRLRGGADGLSLVVPYRDDAYYRARRRTAVAPPGSNAGSALPLTTELGLHPSLGALRPLVDAGELGVVTNVGLPAHVRSHARAWEALDEHLAGVLGDSPLALNGPLARQTAEASALLRGGRAPLALSIESLDWDTHAAQGEPARGRLARAARELADALTELRAGAGERFAHTLVVVLTEFGRSLSETPLGGTDDGHASVLFVLGGGRRFGCVDGGPPQLAAGSLTEGRHVPVMHDIRGVIARLVRGEPPL